MLLVSPRPSDTIFPRLSTSIRSTAHLGSPSALSASSSNSFNPVLRLNVNPYDVGLLNIGSGGRKSVEFIFLTRIYSTWSIIFSMSCFLKYIPVLNWARFLLHPGSMFSMASFLSWVMYMVSVSAISLASFSTESQNLHFLSRGSSGSVTRSSVMVWHALHISYCVSVGRNIC